MSVTTFAYAQVRLQARQAERPGATDWRRVQAINDISHYLQVARRTRLRPWVLNLHSSYDSHRIEGVLRQHYREYVDEVARWLPDPWAHTLVWLKRLPDLPAIRYLLSGGEPLPWMRDDPRLQAVTRGGPGQRMRALEQAGYAELVTAWRHGESLTAAWSRQWRNAWPAGNAGRHGLDELAGLLEQHWNLASPVDGYGTDGGQQGLLQKLTLLFRRYSFQPAACYAHLALTVMDLLALRGDLLRRVLFPANGGLRS